MKKGFDLNLFKTMFPNKNNILPEVYKIWSVHWSYDGFGFWWIKEHILNGLV
jgi:hypothetical protein